jgi:hypothetical protein
MSDEREDRVRDHAHSLWENEGRSDGRALHHWLKAEQEAGSEDASAGASSANPDDVDRAAGPSHGDEDFGGHDAETEGAAAAGVGGQKYQPGAEPKQAGTDEPEVGEERVGPGPTKP